MSTEVTIAFECRRPEEHLVNMYIEYTYPSRQPPTTIRLCRRNICMQAGGWVFVFVRTLFYPHPNE